jgi:hypothetical protein
MTVIAPMSLSLSDMAVSDGRVIMMFLRATPTVSYGFACCNHHEAVVDNRRCPPLT